MMILFAGFAVTWLFAGSPSEREPPSELAPESQADNARGIAEMEAGRLLEGVVALERAYAGMPDALRYRAGRGKVLGSIRGALNDLHTATGDPVYLQRLQGLLVRHLEALLAALGDAATANDARPYLSALREVEEELARAEPRGAAEPESKARTGEARTVGPARAPATSHGAPVPRVRSASRSRLRVASSVGIGAGVVALGVSIGTAAAHVDNRNKLASLNRSLARAGVVASPAVWQAGESLHDRARDYRTVAIVTGIFGGAAVVTAVVMRVLGKRRAAGVSRGRLAPMLTLDAWGVQVGGEF